MVYHNASLTVEIGESGLVGEKLIGNQTAFSHARNDHVDMINVTNITHVQLIAGYIVRNARKIKDIVIGTRFK